jgi:hypothetical protein
MPAKRHGALPTARPSSSVREHDRGTVAAEARHDVGLARAPVRTAAASTSARPLHKCLRVADLWNPSGRNSSGTPAAAHALSRRRTWASANCIVRQIIGRQRLGALEHTRSSATAMARATRVAHAPDACDRRREASNPPGPQSGGPAREVNAARPVLSTASPDVGREELVVPAMKAPPAPPPPCHAAVSAPSPTGDPTDRTGRPARREATTTRSTRTLHTARLERRMRRHTMSRASRRSRRPAASAQRAQPRRQIAPADCAKTSVAAHSNRPFRSAGVGRIHCHRFVGGLARGREPAAGYAMVGTSRRLERLRWNR